MLELLNVKIEELEENLEEAKERLIREINSKYCNYESVGEYANALIILGSQLEQLNDILEELED